MAFKILVGILKESQEHIDKQGARWIARLAKASALVVMGEIDDDWDMQDGVDAEAEFDRDGMHDE